MNRGAWWATVHRITKSQTWLKQLSKHACMVFPVVMYGCESWTIKKADCQRIGAFELWCWRRLFKSPLDCKEIKPVNPKTNQPWIFIERIDVKFQYFDHLMWRANSLEKTLMLGKIESKNRRGWQRMRWLDIASPIQWDMNLSKLREKVEDRGTWHATVHGVAKSWTWLSD